MDIEALLREGHNKEITSLITSYIGDKQSRFDEFMPTFLHDEYRICQRAAWVLGYVCENNAHLILKWMPEIMKQLKNPKHDAIVRNVVRSFQFLDPIPEQYEGEIYDLCFEFLYDPKYPIAFKAFSMSVCRRIALKYPDLKEELIQVIEEQVIHGSSGIRSRGKRELGILRKGRKEIL